MRGFVAEASSWSLVQALLCQSDFFVGDLFELAVFGKKLAQQAVEIFFGAAFPGCVRMRKVVARLQRRRDPFMLRKLLTDLALRMRTPYTPGLRGHSSRSRRRGCGRVGIARI